MKLGHWEKVPEVVHIRGGGVEIELVFTLSVAVSEILADFQNCHMWA